MYCTYIASKKARQLVATDLELLLYAIRVKCSTGKQWQLRVLVGTRTRRRPDQSRGTFSFTAHALETLHSLFPRDTHNGLSVGHWLPISEQ